MALLGGVAQLAGGANPQQLDENSEGEEDNALQDQSALKDVFWDRIVVFLTTAIIALTALDILTELLRGGSQVACFISDSLNVTDGQEAYINNFCAQSVPDTQYLPIFILTHGILIGAWHYIWRSSCASHFNYFLSLASQLIRLSDDPQGFYPQKNLIIISKLASEFRTYNRSRILRWYQLKLIAQILTAVASLLLSFLVFTDFEVNFDCPRDLDSSNSWPLPGVQVQCIFTSLRLFSLLQVVDVLLLAFIVVALLGALLWSIWRHPTELGPETVAQFSFTSSISPSYHVPRPMLHNAKSFCHRFCSKQIFHEINQRFLVPRLTTDLDFLLMMLYRTDSGLGHTFKEGQVYEEYKQLTDADFQGLGDGNELSVDPKLVKKDLSQMLKWRLPKNVYDNFVQTDMSSTLQIPSVIRGAVLGFAQRATSNTRALDISFGSYGFSTVLARAFRHVGSLNFDPSFKDEETPVVSFKFPANITGFRCHDNILSQEASSSNQLTELLEGLWSKDDEPDVYKTEFVVIGPIDQFRQISTAKSILEMLKAKFLNESEDKRTLLVTVVPVSIEGKDARKQFYTFVPPKNLFTRVNHSVEIVHDPDDPLTWPNKQSPIKEKEKEDSPKPAGGGGAEEIQLHPMGPVTVTLEQEANEDDNDKLITTHGTTSLRSVQLEDTRRVTQVYELQCGNTICDFELALYQFIWKPEITYAPPRPPSSSSESESSTSVEGSNKEGEKDSSSVNDDACGKGPPVPRLPKVENTAANMKNTDKESK